MYCNKYSANFERAIKSIELFLDRNNIQQLNKIEQAIIRGSLARLTYKKMQQQEQQLNFYTVEYISRNLAYALWKKLTIAAQNSGLFCQSDRVNKLKIWNFVEEINQRLGTEQINPLNIPATALEGKKMRDRYVIEEYLFERDSGERHFRARDLQLDNRPCLVIQRSHQTSRIKQQFEREGKVLSQIGKHYQIPELLAYFVRDISLYLIYEQLSGRALTELLGEPWQEAAVISLLRNLLTALVFIQQKSLIHRNLNPDNIVLSDNNWVLTDFATVKESNQNSNSISPTTFAQGMKGYMPAEQLMGMATFASDIYAVGMIAVHTLTGIHPRQLKIDPKTGSTIWRNKGQVTSQLGEIIDRAICYHFCDRYQSAQEMLENLK